MIVVRMTALPGPLAEVLSFFFPERRKYAIILRLTWTNENTETN